jgi:hypothetical protein
MAKQPALPLTPPVRCLKCNGTGEVYYLAHRATSGPRSPSVQWSRPEIVGGQRVVCPECVGLGWVGEAGDGS